MYDGARVPSPEEGANGVPLQPETPAANEEPETEEGVPPKPVLVKKAHREILDHERKRRVELKCMELQEMMEEQGYSEEEIKQKVGTFRQMLMEKEGVILREGSNPRPPVRLVEDEDQVENCDGYEEGYDWDGEYYDHNLAAYDDGRSKRKSSSSASPRPKKRKKKKRRHSRAESSSPTRREKRKRSNKKHKRDRSTSGSRRKRRHRSGSPKNKHKDKIKHRKRSSLESPGRLDHHTGSCCSSRSRSVSSTASVSRSASRSEVKCRHDRLKQEGSRSPPPSPRTEQPTTRQNGSHSARVRNGKDSGANHTDGNKGNDKLRPLAQSPSGSQTHASPHLRGAKHHAALPKSPTQTGGDACADVRPLSEASGRRGGRPKVREKTTHSPAHSSDSQRDPHTKTRNHKKRKGSHASKRHHRGRGENPNRSSSVSPGRHKNTSKKKKKSRSGRQRSRSWSSARSSSPPRSRERDASKNKSPHVRQDNSRERDSSHHSDAERARRRSRSYSPIRKRRRDSPSFMEARRITSARKRPIPYYRPSPSSSSSASSYSSSSRSRSRSRSYYSYSSYSSYSRSRSRSKSRSRSRSRSPSAARSYYSQSSYESPGF